MKRELTLHFTLDLEAFRSGKGIEKHIIKLFDYKAATLLSDRTQRRIRQIENHFLKRKGVNYVPLQSTNQSAQKTELIQGMPAKL